MHTCNEKRALNKCVDHVGPYSSPTLAGLNIDAVAAGFNCAHCIIFWLSCGEFNVTTESCTTKY